MHTIKNLNNISSQRKQNILFAILLLAVSVLYIWKAPYGLSCVDESFFLTVPKRILQGDNLLLDEWHLSQFSGVLLLPIMLLYNILGFENGEYIILFFRYAYVSVHILISLFIYYNLKKKTYLAFVMVLYMFFTPSNIMALSYNSMGVMFLTAALAALNNTDNKRAPIYSGVFFSASVLCNPYLILLYACYFILLCLSKRLKSISNINFVENKVFIKFTIGCIPLALCVVLLLLRSSIDDIIQVIPSILSDPEHQQRSFLSILYTYFQSPLMLPYSLYLYPLFVVLVIASLIFNKKTKLQNYIWIFACIVLLFMSIFSSPLIFNGGSNVNFFQFPIALFGLISFLTSSKKDWNLMVCFYIPAMIYTFLMHATSNNGFYAVCCASAVASIPSILFAINKLNDFNTIKWKILAKAAAVILIMSALIPTAFTKAFIVFRDSNVNYLNSRVQSGHNQGIMTTEENADNYYSLYDDTQYIREQKDGKVLYFMFETGLYLTDNKEMASFSAWTSIIPWDGIIPQNPDCNRLKEYYKLFPEKRPDYVYIHTKDYSIVEYIMNELSLKGDLYEGEQGYSIIVK